MVNCPATWGCTLFCDGGSACQNATLTCSTGTCEFDCNKGNTVCDGATLECGSGSCNHTCGNMITGPTVNDNNGACELNNNGC
jgi:hypothetical protein